MDSASSVEYFISWNRRQESLCATFPQLLVQQRFVDVTLACEGHQLHCHRLVLASCSTYIKSLLDENPCKHPIIILPRELKLLGIQALVDFIYKGEVIVSEGGLYDFLECAKILEIGGLCELETALNSNQVHSTSTTTTAVTTSSTFSTAQDESETVLTPDPSPSPTVQNSSNTDRFETVGSTSPTRKRHQQSKQSKSTGGSETAASHLSVLQNSSSGGTAENSTTNRPHSLGQQRDEIALSKFHSFSGKYHLRKRRFEATMLQAAEYISRGQSFQAASDLFKIPIPTIRYFMARKGILPKRYRGRSAAIKLREQQTNKN